MEDYSNDAYMAITINNDIDKAFFDVVATTDDNDVVVLPDGILLYRAAETLEEHPTPRFCNDTYKFGVYFSCGSPYLSETMCTEYNQNLIIGVYQTTQPILLVHGKLAHQDQDSQFNISHVDESIGPMFATRIDDALFAEIFLTEDDVKNVKLLGSYECTVQQSIARWGFNENLRWKRDALLLNNKVEKALELGLPVELD